MKFINIYLDVLKKFGDFKSRSNRAEFWIFVLVNFIISFLLGLVRLGDYFSLGSIYSLVVLVPSLAVSVRRLHDIGKSGWNILWGFLPIIGWIYLIILHIKEGEPQANKWGEVPADLDV